MIGRLPAKKYSEIMSKKYYPDVEASPDFPAIEEKVLKFWETEQIFKASVEQRLAENGEFIFYDGPPFANGLPHYGHLLTGFVKDIVARYQTMRGKRVERRFGWDCHGLPAEMGVEKEIGISGRIQITEYGIDKFNEHCRSSVMKYTSEWEDYVTRQARWVDFTNGYKTMDITYMESVMWAFKQLHEKGLVYESMRVMPYSWACETPLSNFETRMDNSYRERADKAVTVAFTLNGKPDGAPEGCKAYRLWAWTTTPWTLPSNLALAVGPGMKYFGVVTDAICNIVAGFALPRYIKELGADKEFPEGTTFEITGLVGMTYQPLFSYFKSTENAFRVLAGDFVMEGDGTGTVHIAPGFGEDDFALCAANDIPIVCPVDNAGRFTTEIHDLHYKFSEEILSLHGRNVLETNDDIIKYLKGQGSWIKTEQYLHNYPHCWRTDTPLIYKAVPSWYVEVTKFRDRMVELNQDINWIPGHIKDGLFGKWLENARDWSISRNRFWGAPIPVWKSDNPLNKKLYVYGSIAELEADFGVKITDLHKPFIDDLTRPDPENPEFTLRRVPDVFDCWFESGSMPYAQIHYMGKPGGTLPPVADFIVEYTAQTRGWFYTLMVLSTALFDRPPFLNCICHGVILDEKGQKLSKRLNNYADPKDIFKQYGADALRWLMVSSPVMRGQELLIDKEGKMVRDVLRLAVKPIWNAYNFFTLYANSDGIKAEYSMASEHLMDQYILSKAADSIHTIRIAMDTYNIPDACAAISDFFEVLSNWYIRRSRPRFWKTEHDGDKQSAYNTLYTVLHVMCRAAAPLLPLTTEEIYQGLTGEKSVHLADYPAQDFAHSLYKPELTQVMDQVRDVCNAALSIRNAQNLRVRLPLASCTVIGKDMQQLAQYGDIIRDEINVKEILFQDNINDFATLKLQINFPVLGKRLPEKMKQIIPASKKGEWKRIDAQHIEIIGETLSASDDEFSILLEPKDKNAAQPLSSQDALVMLDLNVTEALKQEGVARDIIRAIQQARKEADLDVADRIHLTLGGSAIISSAVDSWREYIAEQTLSLSINVKDAANGNFVTESEMEGEKITIGFSVA